METEKLTITFGRRNYPDDVQAVWGARMIWPRDLVYDRQDLASHNDAAKEELIAWLNGPHRGDGAIFQAREALNDPYAHFPKGQADESESVLYEDEHGRIVGSPQGSYGYVYVCAWLFKHTEA